MKWLFDARNLAYLALLLWYLGYVPHVSADPLDLSNVPLSLSIKVKPNVLFLIDNTGSMEYEVMTKDAAHNGRLTGTQPDGSSPACAGSLKGGYTDKQGTACQVNDDSDQLKGYKYGAKFPQNSGSPQCTIAGDEEWRFRNSEFNPLYYDPTKIYKPWPGLNPCTGQPFQEFYPSAALDDPSDCNSKSIDLLNADSLGNSNGVGFSYYTWANTYNSTDPQNPANNCQNTFDDLDTITRFRIRDADAATKQNFANWFSYHRRRSSEVKAVVGNTIASASANMRMGLALVSSSANDTTGNRRILDMVGDATSGNKGSLLQGVNQYKIVTGNANKALLTSLDQAGKYFMHAQQSFPGLNGAPYPFLDADNGGTCQQSFTILLTDGPYDDGHSFSSQVIGNADNDHKPGPPYFDGGAYADSYSRTAADIAMYYYETDLQPSLANNVPITPGMDQQKQQHMVTYVLTFGAAGNLTSNPPDSSKSFSWGPDPTTTTADNKTKIDDLRHAAYNGRGRFFRTTNPDELAAALKVALEDIDRRTSSSASVALNSGSRSTTTHVYQARFTPGDADTGTWSGELSAYELQNDGKNNGKLREPSVWDASEKLNGQNFDTDRHILTYHPVTKDGIAFRWNALDTTQQVALHTDSNGVNDGHGQARLDYLRGSKANEDTNGYGYRKRVTPLGDLVNSDPFFVGAPPFPNSIGADYDAFRSQYVNRTPQIIVGGNDGFLHIFDAATGRELLAYLPNVLFHQMSRLTSPTYSHRYYVDGSPTVGDVKIDINSNGSPQWRTVVVGGLRAGGQGYFALDITDPSTFSESNASKLVLWEFTDADDPDLGFTFSQPSIVHMANGRWAAVFGNGYHSKQTPLPLNATGHAVLYIVFLDGGLDGTWTPGTDYIKIDTKVGDRTTPNGLATPTPVDTNGDLKADYIVAGDLRGNLWAFDVRDANPSNWNLEYMNGSTPVPLFTATVTDPTTGISTPQPITARPEVGEHPEKRDGFIVYFGTGKYLEPSDTSTTSVQTFYGVWDKNEQSLTSFSRSNLLQQSVIAQPVVNGQTVRVTSDNAINWDTKRGWYLDLPATGERQVSDSVLRNGRIIFTTLIPATKICEFGGTSFLMELNVNGGRRLDYPPIDLDQNGTFDTADDVKIDGQETKVHISGIASTEKILSSPTVLSAGGTELKYSSGSSGGVFIITENPGPGSHGRQAWRQLF
jgi:type IV pilus assembly protein PilY1